MWPRWHGYNDNLMFRKSCYSAFPVPEIYFKSIFTINLFSTQLLVIRLGDIAGMAPLVAKLWIDIPHVGVLARPSTWSVKSRVVAGASYDNYIWIDAMRPWRCRNIHERFVLFHDKLRSFFDVNKSICLWSIIFKLSWKRYL